ncbi:PRELI domain-containing protein 1, mitochondrial [Geodia barretti]|uniref:PRELI domain-containing protein 1, mitochondrial n=1 Tax=Geodia barretti TaxID=519541 RepID=A0AA35QY23_GEOBA|nr:PRELI domain-containing protein 1, mitochondrial [Geodia barretti]
MRTNVSRGCQRSIAHNMSSPDSGAGGRTSREEGKVSRHLGLFHSHVYTYRTPWEKVAQALWQRYPNPYSNHVLSEDTLSRQSRGRRLLSRRLLRKTNSAPKWLERFVGGKGASACIVEESEVDMATKTFTTYTRNVNFNKLMTVEEKAIYTVSPENKEWLETRLILHMYIYGCEKSTFCSENSE